jgi:hypothetical protein
MRHKQRPSGLSPVTKIPTRRRPGRPYKSLSSAVARSAPEREVLVMLRKRIATRLDSDDLAPAAFGALVRQFRQIDAQLRALDAAAATLADEPDDEGNGDGAGWDPSKLQGRDCAGARGSTHPCGRIGERISNSPGRSAIRRRAQQACRRSHSTGYLGRRLRLPCLRSRHFRGRSRWCGQGSQRH